MMTTKESTRFPPFFLGQALVAVMIGLALFVAGLGIVPVGYELAHRGRIYPGVSVNGIDLSNLSPEEAAMRLVLRLDYPQRGQIAFQEGKNVWVASPKELGLTVDYLSTARAAYSLGRTGGLLSRFSTVFTAWYAGKDLPPLFVLDERVAQNYLMKIAAQVDVPIIEASLGINGVDVVVRPGQVGRTLDVDAALGEMRPFLEAMIDGVVPLIVRQTPPVILDASQQAEVARRILSAPLVIQLPEAGEGDPGPWSLPPETLAAWLTIQRVKTPEGERYQVGLNTDYLRGFLVQIAPNLLRYPQNARFIFNDDTRQLELIQSAVIGRSLDVDASLQAINDHLIAGEHSVNLVLATTNPEVIDNATAEQLGIRELVSSHSSYFYGSATARIQNIQTASARFHGLLVPPGAVFSMASALGDVSLDTGYAEALIILGDRTIQGVGGGVCQVSTTFFRTAFLGGFPIVERHPHAYRVGYYEQTPGGGYDSNLAGLDATVFVPVVDFKFQNDTPYWLLMETYVDVKARRLTWKFYSTSDGRSVQWESSGLQNIVKPPEPQYEENPDLKEGEIKQVDWAVEGADVTITRTVTRDGQVINQDTFTTHYLPWRAVYQYGPGTEIPTPEPTEEP